MMHDTGYRIRKLFVRLRLLCILHLVSIIPVLLFTAVPAEAGLDIKRNVLENGLTLLIVERHNLPIVMVSVLIKAGSLNEPEEKAGLASLTAGLLTAGTKKRTASQISEEGEFVGASLSTSGGIDYVTVALSVLKKDVLLGFDLLSDVILNPVFPEKEINKKIKQIKASLKAREDKPGFVALKAFKKEVFGMHPYGRLASGRPETLDRIKRADLIDYHLTYYAPNNAIMSVVGDITPEEVNGLLKEHFSEWLAREIKIPSFPEIKKNKNRKAVVIDKDLTQANIIMGHLGISRGNPDYYKVSVMNYILGSGGFASRLMQNIRGEKGLVYDIHSFFAGSKYSGFFKVGLQTKNESANTAIGEVLKEIKKIRDIPVSETELSDAKAFLTGSFPMRIETSRLISSFLVAVEYYGLGMDYIDNYPDYINSVTKEDVLNVAKKYLYPEEFILVVVGNQEKTALKSKW
ncbi:MAG: pitrilysin family protein [Thermodesulfovibrionia bacterium]